MNEVTAQEAQSIIEAFLEGKLGSRILIIQGDLSHISSVILNKCIVLKIKAD